MLKQIVKKWNRRKGDRTATKDVSVFQEDIGLYVVNQTAMKYCWGMTELCSRFCYCKAAIKMYKDVKPAHERNIQLFIANPFAWMDSIINEIQRRGLVKYRFFSFGDIYNLNQIWAIQTIVQSCPDCRFIIYTKTWQLGDEWLSALRTLNTESNIEVHCSYDVSSQEPPEDFSSAEMILNEDESVGNCIKQITDKKYNCSQCDDCFNGGHRKFRLHGAAGNKSQFDQI